MTEALARLRFAFAQPDIPQNVGAAIRLAACFGVPFEVIEPCAFALTDKAVRRAAMDYGARADVTRQPSWTAFRAAHEDRRLVLFTTKGAVSLWQADVQPADVLVFGSESRGADEAVHAAAALRVFIPLVPGARSLNVVNAAAIALGEVSRRGLLGPIHPVSSH